MTSKKFLVLAILASIFAHAVVLSLTGFVDMNGESRDPKPLTVSLKEPEKATEEPAAKPPAAAVAPAMPAALPPVPQEDTVALENPDSPYTPYLLKVKYRINRRWIYPPEAASRGHEGETVVRFSIAANGSLAGADVVTSAGSELLDRAALNVIRASSPFGPLPRPFRLERLHIVARFQYRLKE
ncbi:MAG TPA: hypothetical protein DCS11_10060 [Syntrophus sp. (in: bacteria)]|nr:hypothetical protein [Syntrophus sp. (in: bacteria)]